MVKYYDYNDKLAVKDILFTPISGVVLNNSLFKTVFNNNIHYLDTLNMDSMMYWFDVKTDTPTSAEPYRGHFEDNLKGSTLFMFLMGAGNVVRWAESASASDIENMHLKIHTLMERLRTSADNDGFLMPIDKHNFAYREYPHYVRIWLTYALCAVGFSSDEEAFVLLRKWQDWFNSCSDLPIIKYLELAFQGIVASTYLYTTPIGRRIDIDTTIEAYEEPWRLAQFLRGEKNSVHIRKQPGTEPHAHGSELEGIEGYLDLYRATGRNYYLNAVLGAYNLYKNDWQHVGGGIVMCEGMDSNYPGCNWLDSKNNYNELCCTSFWIYLNLRLHRLFPDKEIYMNEIEKSLFNIAIANQDGSEGIRYFAYLEGKKQLPGHVHCCCGVGTRIFGSLPEFIYSVGERALSVNLYSPSEIEWKFGKLVSEGNIPYTDDVKLTIFGGGCFALRLRIPSWTSEDSKVEINGTEMAIGKPGTYLVIDREWSDGDVIKYTLKQSFKLTKYSGADELPNFGRYYIEHGPLLYAVSGSDFKRARLIGWSTDDFESWLTPSESLCYNIAMHDGYKLVPYFVIRCNTEFTCCPIFN